MSDEIDYVGKVWLDRAKRLWMIQCEPATMRVLKRMFERIPKDTPTGIAPLVDSPQNCKSILWFMAGAELEIGAEDLVYLREQAEKEKARSKAVRRVLTGKYEPPTFKLGIEPWPFQYLPSQLCLAAGAVLCADEVGIGKSLESALIIADPRARPALVVVPAQLVGQWEERLKQYLTGLRTHVLKKRTPYDLPQPMPDVFITTYAKLAGWADALKNIVNSVTYDEVHNLCHEWADTSRTQRVAKYEAALVLRDHVRFRCGLSGTPIKNYGGEIRTVTNVLMEDALGTAKEFGREWCNGATGEKALLEDPHALGAYMIREGIMTSRTRKEVGRYLPDVSVHVHPIEVDMKRLNAVKVDTMEYARTLLRRGVDPEAKRDAAREIDWRLRHATGLAKAPAVIELTRMLAARSPVLLLAWHHDFWREIRRGLEEFNPVFFTGQQTPRQKEEAVRAFLAGESQIFCMSHRAAEGVDGLQHVCSTVVMGELDWTYAVMMKQNVGRLQREGQKEKVFVHVPLADDGSDPVIAAALGIKKEQLEGILQPNAPKVTEVQTDPEHVKELARSWMRAHDPKGLAAIEREIAEAAQKKADEKEARRAKRKGVAPAAVTASPPEDPAPSPPPDPTPILGETARLSIWDAVANRERVAVALGVPLDDVVAEVNGDVRVRYHRPLEPGEEARIADRVAQEVPWVRVSVIVDGPPAREPSILPPSPFDPTLLTPASIASSPPPTPPDPWASRSRRRAQPPAPRRSP